MIEEMTLQQLHNVKEFYENFNSEKGIEEFKEVLTKINNEIAKRSV